MDIYDSLNPEQRKAVCHFEGPLLILAGAGSGKTRVITNRVAWLIKEKGVNPWNILAITFTNKAAQEMRDRVDSILGQMPEVWVSTFHSMCVRILRRYIDRLGFSSKFVIYDSDDQKSVVRDACKRLNIDTKLYHERSFMNIISSAKDDLISAEDFAAKHYNDQDLKMKMAAEVYREYQKELKANNALDFDDLICKTVELFSSCPDVLDYYQERFRFIMVDEYQDTNMAQFKLVSQLSAKYGNLCVVGDDDQSIYRFRGADIENILNFEQIFPQTKVIRLEQNYRSTQNILDAANAVIKKNSGRKDKTLWTANGKGSRIHFRHLMNAYEEADYVADQISQAVRSGSASYRDFAILYRTNAQSRIFEEKFLLSDISYKIIGGINFYARKEIKDVLAYLKTISNASDDLAVRRIINVPHRGIGATTISRVQDYAAEHNISFYEALCQAEQIQGLGRALTKLDNFVQTICTFRSKADFYSVRDLIQDVIEGTGYMEELKAEGEEEAEERRGNIDELLNKAAVYDENDDNPSLEGFLEEVALVSDIDETDDGADQVLMMTLHSAKGLEFPIVFLVGMEEGVFPGYMSTSSENPAELEEERRLCYVGITRAKNELYMTAARQRMVRGDVHYNQISRFVEDIPAELFEDGKPGPRYKKVFTESSDEKTEKEKETGSRAKLTQDSGRVRNANQNAYRQAQEAFHNKAFASAPHEISKADLSYAVGDRVKHIKFGSGIVKCISDGGRDYEVTVDFDRVGTKKMFASFAKLVREN